jgi:hypothetical protein
VYKYEKPDTINDIKNSAWNSKDEMVNITSFNVEMNPEDQIYEKYDIRRGSKLQIPKGYNRRVWKMGIF